jgi:hypothetical protein
MDENQIFWILRDVTSTMKKGSKKKRTYLAVEIINSKCYNDSFAQQQKREIQALFFELQGSNSYDLKPIGFES